MALRPSVTGVGGVAPPPGAPQQSVTGADTPTDIAFANLNPDTLAALGDRIDPTLVGLTATQIARVNERELAPLNPVPAGAPPVLKTPVVAASDVVAASVVPAPPTAAPQLMDAAARRHPGRLRPSVSAPLIAAPGVVAASAKPSATVAPGTAAHLAQARPAVAAAGPIPEQSRPNQASRGDQPAHQPAASNTDSPSRGIPTPSTDPGKTITGGFGSAADAQYFPLDGSELLKAVWLLMDELAARIKDDLRFSMAITYPRVSAKVQVVIEGYTVDQPMVIERVMPPHSKTPVELAAAHADEVVFIVKTQRREFDDLGASESPPNAIRDEIGAVIPRKQVFGEGPQRTIADISS